MAIGQDTIDVDCGWRMGLKRWKGFIQVSNPRIVFISLKLGSNAWKREHQDSDVEIVAVNKDKDDVEGVRKASLGDNKVKSKRKCEGRW